MDRREALRAFGSTVGAATVNPAEHAFRTWEQVFERPKLADAVVITTPDALHHGPCMKALAMGDMVGDMTELVVTDFRTERQTKLVPKAEDVEGYQNSGHGGGDWLLAHDFVRAVAQQNPRLLTSTIDESIESRVMGFMAEESRQTGRIMPIRIMPIRM